MSEELDKAQAEIEEMFAFPPIPGKVMSECGCHELQPGEWTYDRKFEQFCLEVRQKFEAENAAWRDDPDLGGGSDSFFWGIYESCEITREHKSEVMVILPRSFAIYAEFVEMFNNTSVGWFTPQIRASLIDGAARLVVNVVLVDYMDDKMLEECGQANESI